MPTVPLQDGVAENHLVLPGKGGLDSWTGNGDQIVDQEWDVPPPIPSPLVIFGTKSTFLLFPCLKQVSFWNILSSCSPGDGSKHDGHRRQADFQRVQLTHHNPFQVHALQVLQP